jgi:hypothetical protein
MNATVIVAALGFIATLLGGWLGAYWQHRSSRDLQLLDAKIRVYGECAASLYEYERATYNRVKARLDGEPDLGREELRQEAYRTNSSARAAIGQLSVLSANAEITRGLDLVRRAVGDFNASPSHPDLRSRHDAVYSDLDRLLSKARSDLVP